MAYQQKELKIYPGGLNLLPPSDQVAEGDCLDLTDFWPGASGRLEQSPELATISSGIDFGKDSLLQANGRIYYGGSGNLSQIGRGRIDSGYDGYPLGMISFQGFAWIMNATKQRRDDGVETLDWWIEAPTNNLTPTVLPGGGSLNGHAYQYYFTWFFAGLGETNPSTVTVQTVDAGDAIQFTLPGITPPDGVTGWNIYRQDYIDSSGTGVFGLAYLINPSPIPIAQTQYTDYGDLAHNQDDTSIRELGVILADDHDPPPPAKVVANQTFNGRIVVANTAANPNRIFWTDALEPAFFPGANDPNAGNWADIGTDSGDPILAIAVRPLTLIIYRQKSIWRVLGDFDDPNSRIDPIVPELGIAGPRAIVSTSVGDYFVASAKRGLYTFNNDWAQKLSDKVDPIFRGLPTENYPTFGVGYESQVAVGYRDGRLWISYPLSDGFPACSLIYHLESQRFFASPLGCGAFLDTGSQFLGINADVLALESIYRAGSTILGFQSQYHNASLPDHEKTWADLVINHNTQGQTLTIVIRTNKNANPDTDSFTLATFSSNAMTKTIFPLVYPSDYVTVALQGLPVRSYSLSVRITGNGADDVPIVIDGPMLIHYYLEARRAKSFDTDETEHGSQSVKIVDQAQFDIDANDGPATLQVYSDVPGGPVIPRLGIHGQVVPKTVHRQSRLIVLSTPAAGRLLRYTVTTPTDFQIYGMRVRVLPVGVYLDGTVGDFWQPATISIGV